MARPCSICTHPQRPEIHELIKSRLVSGETINFRDISSRYGMSYTAVGRHISDHLKLKLQEVLDAQRIEEAIDVYEEFREQLTFAKQLHIEAKELLAHPTEVGRLDLRLSAHEVDLTYYDHGELNEWGKPRKKTDTMQFLVDEITSKSQAEPVKITLKHLDMRKFALECLDRADMCIDKFARMGGDYAKEKTNPTDIKALAEEIAASLIREGHPADQVQAEVSKLFPQLVSEAVN